MAPPIIETVTYWPDCGKYNWKLYKNGFLVILGKYNTSNICFHEISFLNLFSTI